LSEAQTNHWYFLAWLQSLQLPSTQSKSSLAIIPHAPKSPQSTVNSILHFSYFDPDYPISELTATGLARVCCKILIGIRVSAPFPYNVLQPTKLKSFNMRMRSLLSLLLSWWSFVCILSVSLKMEGRPQWQQEWRTKNWMWQWICVNV
jgi:hypothetical protein